jgi:hypothetical protein
MNNQTRLFKEHIKLDLVELSVNKSSAFVQAQGWIGKNEERELTDDSRAN